MRVTSWHGVQYYFKVINRNSANTIFIYYTYTCLNCYLESMSRGISYMKYVNGRLIGLVTSYVETAF